MANSEDVNIRSCWFSSRTSRPARGCLISMSCRSVTSGRSRLGRCSSQPKALAKPSSASRNTESSARSLPPRATVNLAAQNEVPRDKIPNEGGTVDDDGARVRLRHDLREAAIAAKAQDRAQAGGFAAGCVVVVAVVVAVLVRTRDAPIIVRRGHIHFGVYSLAANCQPGPHGRLPQKLYEIRKLSGACKLWRRCIIQSHLASPTHRPDSTASPLHFSVVP